MEIVGSEVVEARSPTSFSLWVVHSKYLYAYQKAIDIYSKEFMDNSLSIERTDKEDYCILVRKDRDDDLTIFWDIVEKFKREMSV